MRISLEHHFIPFLHVILFTAMKPPNLNPHQTADTYILRCLPKQPLQGAHSSPDHSPLNAKHNVFGIKEGGEELVNFIEASLRVYVASSDEARAS
jgi:hypothetical protein